MIEAQAKRLGVCLINDDQREKTVVIIAAGRTPPQVRAHLRHPGVGRRCGTGEVQLHLGVEKVETLLAAQFLISWADKALDKAGRLVRRVLDHDLSPSMPSPRAVSPTRSLRRASCNVL